MVQLIINLAYLKMKHIKENNSTLYPSIKYVNRTCWLACLVCQCGIWNVFGGTCFWGRWSCSSASVTGATVNPPGTPFSPG